MGFIVYISNTIQVDLLVNNLLSVINQDKDLDIELPIQSELAFLKKWRTKIIICISLQTVHIRKSSAQPQEGPNCVLHSYISKHSGNASSRRLLILSWNQIYHLMDTTMIRPSARSMHNISSTYILISILIRLSMDLSNFRKSRGHINPDSWTSLSSPLNG